MPQASRADALVPAVQRAPVEGRAVRTVRVTDAATGATTTVRRTVETQLRPAIAERGQWDDPADRNDTGQKQPMQVHGWRRSDPILRLHSIDPGQVTRHHVRACERYRDDADVAAGASPSGDMTGIRASTFSGGPTQAMVEALGRMRVIQSTIAAPTLGIIDAVVLRGVSLRALAGINGNSEHVLKGRLVAGLDQLLHHYEGGGTRREAP